MQHRFSVTVRLKAMTERLECSANLEMVINLSVEDNRSVAIVRIDRLVARRQIDNLETSCAEAAVG
jgi:hypothetical protein